MTQAITSPGQPAAGAAGDIVLDARHLTKLFPVGGGFHPKQVHALTDVSITIRRSRVVSLVGESGSGKSTTARLISRLMPPTSGEIVFKGKDVLKTEPGRASLAYRSDVQMIFQDPFGSLNPVHPIGDSIERPIVIHKIASGKAVQERVFDLLNTVGLTPPAEVARKFPYQLSGGQRQRIAIARALAVNPEVILADEPISMLDVSIRMGVLNLMARLKTEMGIGYLYITHDIASARYIGDETMVMYAGHLVEGADSDELMLNPKHPYTQLLLSAVPNPQAGLAVHRVEARGEIPSLIDPPPGCPFAGRCPHTMDICRKVMPGAEWPAKGHFVRCHLYGPGSTADPIMPPTKNGSS